MKRGWAILVCWSVMVVPAVLFGSDANALDCPPHPAGLTEVVEKDMRVLVSVASAEPLASGKDSADLAFTQARLAAKHALAQAASPDGRTLSGVVERFACVAGGRAYVGVSRVARHPAVDARPSSDASARQGGSMPAKVLATDINQSILANPTPTPSSIEYEVVNPGR